MAEKHNLHRRAASRAQPLATPGEARTVNVRLLTTPGPGGAKSSLPSSASRSIPSFTEKHFTPRLMVVQIAFRRGRDRRPLVDPRRWPRHPRDDRRTRAEHLRIPIRAGARRVRHQVAAVFCARPSIAADLVRDVTRLRCASPRPSATGVCAAHAAPAGVLADDAVFAPVAGALDRVAERGRSEWADEEMRALTDPQTYHSDRGRLYLRVSGNARLNRRELGILNELASLRERVARERNIPLKYVLADDVLLGLVALRPKSVDELAQLRRLDAGARRNLGPAIVDAIRSVEALPEDDLPPRAQRPLGASATRSPALRALGHTLRRPAGTGDAARFARSAHRARTAGRATIHRAAGPDAVARLVPTRFSGSCTASRRSGRGYREANRGWSSTRRKRACGRHRDAPPNPVTTPAHRQLARATLRRRTLYHIFRLGALAERGCDLATLPFSLKVLLENLLRFEDERSVYRADIEALAAGTARGDR